MCERPMEGGQLTLEPHHACAVGRPRCVLTGYEDAAHEHGTRAGRANDASGVPRKGQAPSRRRHGPRVCVCTVRHAREFETPPHCAHPSPASWGQASTIAASGGALCVGTCGHRAGLGRGGAGTNDLHPEPPGWLGKCSRTGERGRGRFPQIFFQQNLFLALKRNRIDQYLRSGLTIQ